MICEPRKKPLDFGGNPDYVGGLPYSTTWKDGRLFNSYNSVTTAAMAEV